MPKFKHDCDACKFLDTRFLGFDYYDWYYCAKCDEGTMIARYGDEGRQYWATPINMIINQFDKKDDNVYSTIYYIAYILYLRYMLDEAISDI